MITWFTFQESKTFKHILYIIIIIIIFIIITSAFADDF